MEERKKRQLLTNELENNLKSNGLGEIDKLIDLSMHPSCILQNILDYISDNDREKRTEAREAVLLKKDTKNHALSGGERNPSRDTFLVFLITWARFNKKKQLSVEDCQQYLIRGGYSPLYVKNIRDRIIYYCILYHKSVFDANEYIYEYNKSKSTSNRLEPLPIVEK